MRVLTFTIYILCLFEINAQTVFYQDIFNGGVAGAGFSTGIITSGATGTISVNISPTSTIKRAFLIFNRNRDAQAITIQFNSTNYLCDSSSIFSKYHIIQSSSTPYDSCEIHIIDVTQAVNPFQNNFNIAIPAQSFVAPYGCFYLIVIYEDLSLPKTAFSLVLNQIDMAQTTNYLIDSLNPIDKVNPVGFAIQSDILFDTTMDGSYVKINGNNLGLIGGTDSANMGFTGAGVKGHFYYQNNTLFGLDDDTPDAVMGGTDGLADISSYLSQYATSINCEFDCQLSTTPYNVYISLPISYTTPCDTFSVKLLTEDTTVCRGQTVQLGVSGGNTALSKPAYEWLPQKDLSCYTCANPVFSGDSSQVYTVRIWNTDSCSKVLPVRVKVLPVPRFGQITTQNTICGAQSGAITVGTSTGSASTVDSLFFNNTFAGLTPLTLSNLGAGTDTLFHKDTNGCVSQDTLVTIESTNNTKALFTVNPQTGAAPLSVSTNNQSTNATDYLWHFLNDSTTAFAPNMTFDTSGTYTVTLLAYQNSIQCADTFSLSVTVYDSLQIVVPNVITANGDGVNDVFSIQVNTPCKGTVNIFNRWGNVVFTKDFEVTKQQASATLSLQGSYKLPLWDGGSMALTGSAATQGKKVVDGVYFYTIRLTNAVAEPVEAQGFVSVVR